MNIDLSNLEHLRKQQIHFCIPSCDGQMSTATFDSIMKFKEVATQLELRWTVDTLVHEVKSRAQNLLVAKFLATFESTHLMFLSKDVAFEPFHVLMMLSSQKHIISAKGTHTTDLIDEGDVKEVLDPNLNFIMISKEAFSHLSTHAAVKEFKNTPVTDPYLKTFFGQGIDFTNFVTEDRLFCQKWNDLGGKAWIMNDIDVLE